MRHSVGFCFSIAFDDMLKHPNNSQMDWTDEGDSVYVGGGDSIEAVYMCVSFHFQLSFVLYV